MTDMTSTLSTRLNKSDEYIKENAINIHMRHVLSQEQHKTPPYRRHKDPIQCEVPI